MSQPIWIDHILIIVFGVVLPVFFGSKQKAQLSLVEHWDTQLKMRLFIGNSLLLWLLGGIVIICWMLCGRSLMDLGFRLPDAGSWGITLLISLLFIFVYTFDVWQEAGRPEARKKTRSYWKKNMPFLPENKLEFKAFLKIAFSAGIAEEIFFRAFFISYLLALFNDGSWSKVLALILPSVFFAIAHSYQGTKAMVKIGILSLSFGLIFILSGSILIPIILHILVDIASSWIAMRVFQLEEIEDEA